MSMQQVAKVGSWSGPDRQVGWWAIFAALRAHPTGGEGSTDVAELVDAPDLGSGAERRGGSSPFARTQKQIPIGWSALILFEIIQNKINDESYTETS